jgi:ketosteroid isomerase-like protein
MMDSYQRQDMDALLACFMPNGDTVMYGTGADEKRIGLDEIRAQAQRDWSQTDAIALDFDWMSISAAGPVAWTAMDGRFEIRANGQSMRMPARLTMVLEKQDDEWRIAQAHFSTPAAGQAEGDSIPA